jgi:hypothetical protein
MEDFQKRVVEEKDELDAKRVKLSAFINSEVFETIPLEEANRLEQQADAMEAYSEILLERIKAFT